MPLPVVFAAKHFVTLVKSASKGACVTLDMFVHVTCAWQCLVAMYTRSTTRPTAFALFLLFLHPCQGRKLFGYFPGIHNLFTTIILINVYSSTAGIVVRIWTMALFELGRIGMILCSWSLCTKFNGLGNRTIYTVFYGTAVGVLYAVRDHG